MGPGVLSSRRGGESGALQELRAELAAVVAEVQDLKQEMRAVRGENRKLLRQVRFHHSTIQHWLIKTFIWLKEFWIYANENLVMKTPEFLCWLMVFQLRQMN